jgi:hypothetical protein
MTTKGQWSVDEEKALIDVYPTAQGDPNLCVGLLKGGQNALPSLP